MGSKRLDILLLERGLISTRTKAQEMIRAGAVLVNGKPCTKPGEKIPEDSAVSIIAAEHPYVSRGGLKLEAVLDHFSFSVEGLRALDVGQSTGGFTHCLLLRGAREVVGLEVGHGQLAESLRADPRVKCWEKTDVRDADPARVGAPFPFCVVDLSFISLRLIIPVLGKFLEPDARAILLVKPQFEVGPEQVGSGGIVRSEEMRSAAVEAIRQASQKAGFTVTGILPSPISGGDGNQEMFLCLRRSP
jgi:23S rRNA (cytidine1920-2'-O)/16S rRNA (cytidine1409-2'-O)-methyltransferase